MPEVTTLPTLAEREPHDTMSVVCLSCKHEWIAVRPEAEHRVDGFECPECGTLRGVLKKSWAFAEGDSIFACVFCDSDVFRVAVCTNGDVITMCIGCGATSPAMELFDDVPG